MSINISKDFVKIENVQKMLTLIFNENNKPILYYSLK